MKSYVNAFFSWHSHGREATCNFCAARVEVRKDMKDMPIAA